MTMTTVLVAGASGMLGNRVAGHLLDQPNVAVRLLLRASGSGGAGRPSAIDSLTARGAVAVVGDVTDPVSLYEATAAADVVVSALQGGSAVLLDGQVALAEAAARNGARRFIPSDFALDLFHAPVGAPQFDVRRRADETINSLPLEVVHVLNGAFMDLMLDPSTPSLIDLGHATVTLWGTGDEPFDLTTVDDTSRFTARLAADPADVSGVRYLSGAQATFNEIIDETEQLSGANLTRNVLGTVEDLRRITREAADPWSVVQESYFLSMLTVAPFAATDNDRYGDIRPMGLHAYLHAAHRALPNSAAGSRIGEIS